jgi:hypothetical protein
LAELPSSFRTPAMTRPKRKTFHHSSIIIALHLPGQVLLERETAQLHARRSPPKPRPQTSHGATACSRGAPV